MINSYKMRILVTGGTGLFGSALQSVKKREGWPDEWFFVSSTDANLLSITEVQALFERTQPTHVIHLAARVGGLFANNRDNVGFFRDNINITMNVLDTCHKMGVKKVVSCLSTCVFPDGAPLPLEEKIIHDGRPHPSNEGYSFAKRMLEVLSRLYSKQYGMTCVSVVPTNLYGENDNFDLQEAHVIPALIHKAYLAKQNGELLHVSGTGEPLRQFMYAEDTAKLIYRVLMEYNDVEKPLMLTVPESWEVSIKECVYLITKEIGLDKSRVIFDNNIGKNGQYQKTASSKNLLDIFTDFQFTTLETGLHKTVQWFISNYPSVRGAIIV